MKISKLIIPIYLSLFLISCKSNNKNDTHAINSYYTNYSLYMQDNWGDPLNNRKILKYAKNVCPLIKKSNDDVDYAKSQFSKTNNLLPAHSNIVFGSGVGAYCREYLNKL